MIDPLIQKYCGWAAPENPGLLEEAFDIFGAFITQMPIFKDRPKRMMLWELNRKLLGEDTPNYPQQDGDCVSFGAKNGCEHLQTFQLKGGDKSKWRFVFPPYIYGISRVQIGGGRIRGAGSLGVWAAQGLTKFGVLFSDVPNVPKYSKAIAQSWGNSGPPKNFIDEAIKHLVKMDLQSAKVTTWEQLTSAIANGYPITVASNYGFTMQPQSSGFHEQSGSWAHQMCIVGYDESSENPDDHCVCILNSWGNAHGVVTDKVTGEKWPIGTLRVRKKVVLRMLVDGGGDSWALSNLDLGFVPRKPLVESDFTIL